MSVYLGAISYRLGDLCDVSTGVLPPEPAEALDLLVAKGVASYARFAADPSEDLLPMCVQETLVRAELQPADIDVVVLVTESYGDLFGGGAAIWGETPFRARRNRLVDILNATGLHRAALFSTTYGGSANFLQALALVRPLVESGTASNALVVCAERHPADVPRFMEQAIAMTGDGVCACVVRKSPRPGWYRVEHVGLSRYRPVAAAGEFGKLVLEMYRASKGAAADCYEAVGRQPGDFSWLVQNNYNDTTTSVFAALLGFEQERTFRANAARTGHVPSCDLLLNLADLTAADPPAASDALLLYANGPVSCGTVSLVVT